MSVLSHHEIQILEMAYAWKCRILHTLERDATVSILLLELRCLGWLHAIRAQSKGVMSFDGLDLLAHHTAEEGDMVALNRVSQENHSSASHPLHPGQITTPQLGHVPRCRASCVVWLPVVFGCIGVIDVQFARTRKGVAAARRRAAEPEDVGGIRIQEAVAIVRLSVFSA